MSAGSLVYYITDRQAFAGDERNRRLRLLDKIAEAAAAGVDYIQLREKDLRARDLESLAREAMRIVQEQSKLGEGGRSVTSFLINSRTDVALSVGAAGVHLRSNDLSPADVRKAWHLANSTAEPVLSASCHSLEEVQRAAANAVSLAIFAPVFEKNNSPNVEAAGLENLRLACHAKIQVLALGGVNLKNAKACLQVGAAGIAGIRLFQENNIGDVVRSLRDGG